MFKLITNIIFILFASFLWSQNTHTLRGKVILETNDCDGITIINKNSKFQTFTQNGGYFNLKVQINDTIIFSAIHIEAKNIIITELDLKKELLLINLNPHVKHIKEIMITRGADITAEGLGLVPKGQKKYTPAERRLKTAGDWSGNGINGGIASIDPLLNAISGRTKQLKKELEIERKEFLYTRIDNHLDKEMIMEKYKIPEEYYNGFIYYILEDETYANALKTKNYTMAQFQLGILAEKYLKLKNIINE